MFNFKRGFTLIEMLIVVTIVGVLASVVMASFGAARGNARDKDRIADAGVIQLGVKLHAEFNNGVYPDYPDGVEVGVGNPIDDELRQFVGTIPTDSFNDANDEYQYIYDSAFDCGGVVRPVVLVTGLETAGMSNYEEVCGSSGMSETSSSFAQLLLPEVALAADWRDRFSGDSRGSRGSNDVDDNESSSGNCDLIRDIPNIDRYLGSHLKNRYFYSCERNLDNFCNNWYNPSGAMVRIVSRTTFERICSVPEEDAPTCELSFSPASVPYAAGGTSVTISWTSNDVADNSTLWVGDTIYRNVGVNSGSQSVTIAEDTHIRFDIWNDDGRVTCEDDIIIDAPVAPPVCDFFSADQASVPSGGGDVVFSWGTTDATSVAISDIGSGLLVDESSYSHRVTADTTFVLTAGNSSGDIDTHCSVTVTVGDGVTPADPGVDFEGVYIFLL